MVDVYRYTRQRKEFERPTSFEDSELKPLGGSLSDHSFMKHYVKKNPTTINLDNVPSLSMHAVNTDRVVTSSKGMKHQEGGWPRDIDCTETHDTSKWRIKQHKDPLVAAAVKELAGLTERAMKQNKQIDMFEEYFLGETADHSAENLSAKTLMLFKDPNDIKRGITKIAWHPEGPGNRLAVAYSNLRFQRGPDKTAVQSYIWDVAAPNTAYKTIQGPGSLCTLAFNNKYTDFLVGGCYNGLVAVWDLRDKSTPMWSTGYEHSHHDPVYDIYWLHGKSGNEFVSASTDGRLMWWDFRKSGQPTDQLIITDGQPDSETREEKVFGGTSLEYNPEAGATKYLAGTEQGIVILANKKPQRSVEINNRYGLDGGKHHGPIYAIHRNPEELKCFLTIGDWTAKIWNEDIKTPIMTTRYHDAYLTDGCWSPTRPGVFFVTQMDGWMHIWDYHYRQNEIAFSHKVGDNMLTSISVQNQPNANKFGSLVAIGDSEGTVTLVELCDALWEPQSNEKISIKQTFERETTREKNLQAARRMNEAKKGQKKEDQIAPAREDKLKERLREVEEQFFNKVGREHPEDRAPASKPEGNELACEGSKAADS